MREKRREGERTFVHVARKFGGGGAPKFVGFGSSSSVSKNFRIVSRPALFLRIRRRKSITGILGGPTSSFPPTFARRTYSTYISIIPTRPCIVVHIAETGQPNGFVEFVASQFLPGELSEKDRILLVSRVYVDFKLSRKSRSAKK